MSDPVFGMTYDLQKVHFETAPASIGRLCPEARGETYWLYAYRKEGDAEYFILSNFRSVISGAGVVLKGGRCTEALPDWILSGGEIATPQRTDRSIKFTEAVEHGLAKDLLRRYSVAFGGRESFLNEVKLHGLPISDLSTFHVLYSEFQDFARTP
jgi:hypothetical protein